MSAKTKPIDPSDALKAWRRWSARITETDPAKCWDWPGALLLNGYGQVILRGRQRMAHRMAWVAANGQDIPTGLQVDHLCSNRRCVNPAHLRICTPSENLTAPHNRVSQSDKAQRPRPNAVGPRGPRGPRVKELAAEVVGLRERGLSYSEIAAVTGTTRGKVSLISS